MKSTIGSSAAPIPLKLDMARPIGTAITTESAKATHTRKVETPAFHRRCFWETIVHSVSRVTLGGGRNSELTQPSRVDTSQTTRTSRLAQMDVATWAHFDNVPRKAKNWFVLRLRVRSGFNFDPTAGMSSASAALSTVALLITE